LQTLGVIVRGVKPGFRKRMSQVLLGEARTAWGRIYRGLEAQKMAYLWIRRCSVFTAHAYSEVNFFVIATIQQKTGGNLSEPLGNLAARLARSQKLR